MSGRSRQLVVSGLVVAASAAILLALVVGYVRVAAVDSNQFANRATTALHDDSVRQLVADKITDDLVLKNQADLIAARPIIQSVASTLVGSRAFTNLFRSAVRDMHRAVFDRDRNTVALTVADVGTIVAAALERLRPALAHKIESTGRVTLIKRDVGSLSATLARLGDRVKALAFLLLALALVLVGGALALSTDRRRTVVQLGIGAAVAGVLLVVAYLALRTIAVRHVEGAEARAAAGAVWDAFLGDLRRAAWILAGAGAVTAAAASSLIRPVDLTQSVRRAGAWVSSESRPPAARALFGTGLVILGIGVLIEPSAFLQLVATVVGVGLVYAGVTVVLRLVYRPPEPREERQPAPARPASAPAGRRKVVTALIGATIIVVAIATFVGTGGATTPAPAAGPCNGREELCSRPLNHVALAATHNSMSVPLPGWYSAEQDLPIAAQLRDGIRGLLIDTHYADRLPNGKLRTYFGSREQLRQAVAQDGINPEAVDAAMRIRDRLGYAGQGKRGSYLCHTLCELGATPLGSVLDDLHDFLIANPGEVVVVINQDYVTPRDFVTAVKDAGLEGLVYRGPTGGEWRTLQTMIDRNQRLLFLAENHAGAAPWYHLAYQSITEETPYAFSKVDQLTTPAKLPASCRPNRGPAGAPLFLINHWITTDPLPLPSNAAKVNRYDVLLRRVRECERIRHHGANLVAVNFYRRGDVFRVVDTINGVG